MTNQFKFGDLVQHENKDFYPEIGVIVGMNTEHNEAKVHFKGYHHPEFVKANELVSVKNLDTKRLDFIERIINIDGMVKREMRKGWVLVDDGIELTPSKPLLRDAIDAAMKLSADN
ncbi:hypothetical protein [Neisseria sicca]|uniref:hypothetical protein n=1 Tax=Neisseria sicca TaxID=490 RepID=UPI000D309A53|nr:hypothetical protein [Neisseria sicca]